MRTLLGLIVVVLALAACGCEKEIREAKHRPQPIQQNA
jgi:hypothetical protein